MMDEVANERVSENKKLPNDNTHHVSNDPPHFPPITTSSVFFLQCMNFLLLISSFDSLFVKNKKGVLDLKFVLKK